MIQDEIAEFRALHAAVAKRSWLSPSDAERYEVLADRLWDRVLAVRKGAITKKYDRSRQGIRSRRAVRVDLTWTAAVHRAITVDIGTGGFAALVAAAPPRSTAVLAKLHLDGGEITVMARVAAARERGGTARVSFAFTDVPTAERLRLQRFILNDALADVSLDASQHAS